MQMQNNKLFVYWHKKKVIELTFVFKVTLSCMSAVPHGCHQSCWKKKSQAAVVNHPQSSCVKISFYREMFYSAVTVCWINSSLLCLPPSSWRWSWRKRWMMLKVWTWSVSVRLYVKGILIFRRLAFFFVFRSDECLSMCRLFGRPWLDQAVLDVVVAKKKLKRCSTQRGNGSLLFLHDLVSALHISNHTLCYSTNMLSCHYGTEWNII